MIISITFINFELSDTGLRRLSYTAKITIYSLIIIINHCSESAFTLIALLFIDEPINEEDSIITPSFSLQFAIQIRLFLDYPVAQNVDEIYPTLDYQRIIEIPIT